jgi:gliding motility-associated-like protein
MAIDTNYYNIQVSPNTDVTYNADTSLITFSPNATTTYTVTATSKPPCNTSASIQFTIAMSTSSPEAIIKLDPNPVKVNEWVVYRNLSKNATTYTWLKDGVVFTNNSNGGAHTFSDTGTYCITLIACNNTCCDTTTACGTIVDPQEFIVIPSGFTPNNDGSNDVLKVISRGITLERFAVYNRWGNRVFETSNLNDGWDGKGSDVATYFYVAVYYGLDGSKKILKGDVTLVR